MGRLRTHCVWVLTFLFIASFFIVDNASADYEENPQISPGNVFYIAIGQPSTEAVPYQEHDTAFVEADFGEAYGDVYILKCNQVEPLKNGSAFKFASGKENVTGKVRIEHTKTDDENKVYCLVVDNMDNARPNDAVPNGYLGVDIKFNWDDGHQTWFMYKMIAIVVVFAVICAVAVIAYYKHVM